MGSHQEQTCSIGKRFAGLLGRRAWFLLMLLVGVWSAPYVADALGVDGTDAADTRGVGRSSRVERLISRHVCWHTDERALAAIPGHAVVRFRDSGEVRYVGPRWTAAALGQVFDHEDHGLVVYVFCL
jgi:hypothetical protein